MENPEKMVCGILGGNYREFIEEILMKFVEALSGTKHFSVGETLHPIHPSVKTGTHARDMGGTPSRSNNQF